ncbi:MAG TPA: YraN family protein [Candidatus Dietzia merdigallinarum]|nr:YraN family protein [Candidatus Dietzia merdigallinarum]
MLGAGGSSGAGRGGSDRRQRIGRLGEKHAAALFTARGGVVLAQNWHHRNGELDLVILDAAGRLRFVEVKARTGTRFGTAAEAVTGSKQHKIRELATAWLTENPTRWREVHFDVVAVDLSDESNPRLELLEDVM